MNKYQTILKNLLHLIFITTIIIYITTGFYLISSSGKFRQKYCIKNMESIMYILLFGVYSISGHIILFFVPKSISICKIVLIHYFASAFLWTMSFWIFINIKLHYMCYELGFENINIFISFTIPVSCCMFIFFWTMFCQHCKSFENDDIILVDDGLVVHEG